MKKFSVKNVVTLTLKTIAVIAAVAVFGLLIWFGLTIGYMFLTWDGSF